MTGVNLYAIFWVPSTLQNGQPTSLTAKYESVAKQFLADYPYHGVANNSTQYYSTKNSVNTYFRGIGGLAGSVVDTDPYPASGCSDTVTPGNCITDAQLQAEISKVMTAHSWTPGLNKMFIVFTSTGEGSCFDGTSSSCAYTSYCAYHGSFGSTTTPTIYANMPYANPTYCYDLLRVSMIPAATFHRTQMSTLPATRLPRRPRIRSLTPGGTPQTARKSATCAPGISSTADWDSGLANQMWNGHSMICNWSMTITPAHASRSAPSVTS